MKLHEVSDQTSQLMYRQYTKRIARIDKNLYLQLERPQTCQDIRDAFIEVQKEMYSRKCTVGND